MEPFKLSRRKMKKRKVTFSSPPTIAKQKYTRDERRKRACPKKQTKEGEHLQQGQGKRKKAEQETPQGEKDEDDGESKKKHKVEEIAESIKTEQQIERVKIELETLYISVVEVADESLSTMYETLKLAEQVMQLYVDYEELRKGCEELDEEMQDKMSLSTVADEDRRIMEAYKEASSMMQEFTIGLDKLVTADMASEHKHALIQATKLIELLQQLSIKSQALNNYLY